MRILFLAHRFPYPPTFGSKVRAFNVIRHLAQRHEVSVLSLARSAEEEREAAGIAPYCREHRTFRVHNPVQAAKMALTLPTPVSASEAFFHSTALQREIDARLARRSVDLVFAHCSAVGRYVAHVEGLPKIIDYCDVDSRKWADYVPHKPWPLSLGYRWEAWRMARTERRLAGRFEQVTVATPGEVETLAELGVRERVDWFPNGVDMAFFQPSAQAFDPDVITFVGRMDYFPNEQCMVDFCARAWPRLRQARPSLRLQIVGAAPTARVLALGRIEGVTVTGPVPDVRPFVQSSALTIAPLAIARGTQNKILEAMAMAVPVIASRIAAQGVDAVPGEHLLAADSVDEICDAVLRVVGDRRERERLAQAGRARVQSHHAWGSAMSRLDGIIERSIRPAGGVRVATAAA
ncbi:TIGR03087 family PEP-CTERM/XrtA system glycosyltransferase [Piscinibacter sp. XHJ-5]|uniref:TIGR03087 family PEP-CTERM/XrtA system glycosyltransferase n=1 Tax=Piscinibacter sp. XHJ-5 TaxID=3037797 RepID=UPI002452ECA4|nr:TIGR03087 family PEP-CTERM/XrtA system glycosyltransferase [Piscinibacter sp. XHJ-5]